MKLKRLELRGFKTFALGAEFLFYDGVTGLIGPNGSGKSNVADAVRWVLGEQSHRAVRGKRTEDIIFAGGPGRAPAGMAEVSITLDNEDGWLPVAFAEVVITRRAYRSGENEYLLNGSRVRLRDLNELLLKAGLSESTFVVIGQGMVDLALSLRPEERRALIDEAADVRRFQVKLEETRGRLVATDQSLARARDLLAEIEPRLKALTEQADRLRRHEDISNQIRTAQRAWYFTLRAEAAKALAAAEGRLVEVQAQWSASREAAEQINMRRVRVEEELLAAEAQVTELQHEFEQARRRVDSLTRQSAVLTERREAQVAIAAELDRDLEVQRRSREALLAERDALLRARENLHSAVETDRRSLAEIEVAGTGACLEQIVVERTQAMDRLQHWRERAAVLTDQLRILEERQSETGQEAVRWQDALKAHDNRAKALVERLVALEREAELLRTDQEALARDASHLQAVISKSDGALQELATAARRVARNLDERRARVDVLERWSDAQAYSAGVRAVMRAASGRGKLRIDGLVGVVADLLKVPQELETAVEVALGGRAQDIVVETWAVAEEAIQFLKKNSAGRATFLPIDVLRPPAYIVPAIVKSPGVRGIASNLVQGQPRFAKVVQHLLGRTLVVDDLGVARRQLGDCPPGWQIVTIDGELVRASGAVTGGTRKSTDAGLLARQRELRELRLAMARLEEEGKEIAAQIAAKRSDHDASTRILATVEQRRAEAAERIRELQQRLAEVGAEHRSLGGEKKRTEEALSRLVAASGRIAESSAKARDELAQAKTEVGHAEVLLDATERAASKRVGEEREWRDAMSLRRTSLAVRERELAATIDQLADKHSSLERLAGHVEEQTRRLVALEQSQAASAGDLLATRAALETADRELAEIQRELEPARTTTAEGSRALKRIDAELFALRDRLASLDGCRREAEVDLNRVREQVIHVQQQAAADLGPAVAAELWSDDLQEVGESAANAGDLRAQVDALRAALRAVGAVNMQAREELVEVAQRHEFLSQQVADMDEAAKALQRLSVELQKDVRQRFDETFWMVGREFRRYFTQLFGGGTARLVLSDPEDPSQSGIEITAQPPGRRVHNLSLLSGGERALTAVALLFAVLAVRPMPFCVLDEVDAALDEANVGRFGQALLALSERTQFLVITHNRGTMEVAASLYGVTMAGDCNSEVVSLRLASDEEDSEVVQPIQPLAPYR